MTGCMMPKVVRIHRFEGEGRTKAFVDVAIGDFIIKGFRIVRGEKGLFLGMPQEKSKEGKWFNTVHAATEEARKYLAEAVMGAYAEQ